MRNFEIELSGSSIRVRNITTPASPWEYYHVSAIKSIVGARQDGFGTRNVDTLQRKNPVRVTDKYEIIINFHDENESSPLKYDLAFVDNQPTWTADMTGLLQALSDINGWLATAGASGVATILTGNIETPATIENTTSGAAGITPLNAKGFSILFEGTGGTFGGIAVDSGYTISKSASLSNGLSSQAYTVPTAADADFPNSPRVLIEYIS